VIRTDAGKEFYVNGTVSWVRNAKQLTTLCQPK